MNAAHPLSGRALRARLAQAVERNALLLSHPAAAAYPDLAQAIAETQDQIDTLVAELRTSDESSESANGSLSSSTP